MKNQAFNMMRMMLCLASLIMAISAKKVTVENRRGDTIWVGTLSNAGKPPLVNGGFELGAGQRREINTPGDWAGRFWARTGCRFGRGRCDTGDCGDSVECSGRGGAPPASLAEFTFNGYAGDDFYDVSLVDGFNVPISIIPTNRQQSNDKYRCANVDCLRDLNNECPGPLQLKSGSRTVGCKSACEAFQTDAYCCRGAHNRPETCRSTDWPVNYPQFFKDRCPDAYSYAYDDHKSTFRCQNTDYVIAFA